MSFLPTFYEHLFEMKAFFTAFKYSQFVFEIFWQKEICGKAADKILVILTILLLLSLGIAAVIILILLPCNYFAPEMVLLME